MNDKTIGKCSICGGRVCVPALWHGVVPPTPTCAKCGATAAKPKVPVIAMEPRKLTSERSFGRFFEQMKRSPVTPSYDCWFARTCQAVFQPGDRVSIRFGHAWKQAVVQDDGTAKVVSRPRGGFRSPVDLAGREVRAEEPLAVGQAVAILCGPHKGKRGAQVSQLEPLQCKLPNGVEFRVASHWLYTL